MRAKQRKNKENVILISVAKIKTTFIFLYLLFYSALGW